MDKDGSKAYEELKSGLKQSLQQQRELEDEFDRLQQEIYDKETEYLSNKSSSVTVAGSRNTYGGNIIKGFDGFYKTHHGHDAQNHFQNDDRLFSLSSAIFVKQQHQDALQDHVE